MRRRDFVRAIASSAVAWPLAARAQEPGRHYRIVYLTPQPPARCPPLVAAFFDESSRNGFERRAKNSTILPEGFR